MSPYTTSFYSAKVCIFYCFSTEYNGLDLIRHGSGMMYELSLTNVHLDKIPTN